MTTTSADTDDQILRSLDEFYRDYYRDQISKLVQSDDATLTIDFATLRRARPKIADDYLTNPEVIRNHLQEALELHDFPVPEDFSTYQVRVVNVHEAADEVVRDVGMYLPDEIAGDFVAIRGQVAKLSDKAIRLKKAVFECQRCGTQTDVPQVGDELQEPHECAGCERQGPFNIDLDESKQYGVNHQSVRLQVLPEKAENFRSDTIDIELENDLVHSVAPGDRVSINATAEMRLKDENTPDVELFGKAESVDQLDSTFEDMDIEPHIERIEEIAAGEPLDDIAESLAPNHYGDLPIKRALALQLFSGPDLEVPDGGNKRGSIHIFLVGDPGVDKSGLLRRMKKLSPRAVFTTGAGSTKAGLTASAVQDDFGDASWTIEAGALVEAHEGLCAIDELDDMDEGDRAGLLEAMSDQEINVSKAGMNPTLPANTTVLAAANPVFGRFDTHQPLGEQVDVTPALFSRFDLIFTMTDDLDPERDRELADHINETYQNAQDYTKNGGFSDDEDSMGPIDDEVLRAYVAKGHELIPKLSDEAATRISNEFVNIRSANDDDGPVPTTPRIIEGLNRLAAAHARMRLSETVTVEDVEVGVQILRRYLTNVGIDPESGEMDVDMVETGTTKTQRDRVKTILSIIQSEKDEHKRGGVPIDTIYDFASDMDISEQKVDHTIQHLLDKGEIYEPGADSYLPS